jgi:hypothetical protein
MKYNTSVINMFIWKWQANRYAKKARKAGYLATVEKCGNNWYMLGGRWSVNIEDKK